MVMRQERAECVDTEPIELALEHRLRHSSGQAETVL